MLCQRVGRGWKGGVGLGNDGVGYELHTARDRDTKLEGEEVGSKEWGEVRGKEGANNAAPCCANTNGTEFVWL